MPPKLNVLADAIAFTVNKPIERYTHRKQTPDEAVDMTADKGSGTSTQTPATPQRGRDQTRLDVDDLDGLLANHVLVTPTPNSNVPTVTAADAGSPPTTPTPLRITQKAQPDLPSTPELASRYIPRLSTAEQVEYKNPHKFCVKPAFWKKWAPSDYTSLVKDLRSQFDPVPFAREHGIPVEEVQQIFTTVVCNPLYNAAEACRRGEEGMAEIFELYNKRSTVSRRWGRQNFKRVAGELASVEQGVVVVTGAESGNKYELAMRELSVEDVKYLKETLTESDLKLLGDGAEERSRDIVTLDD
ncbi:hypothetical protein LTR08_008072 [Meristemomyces frigidus]|nr:hypothetical protein LTR08_008072 [Meristemomyces frigidus]